MQPLELSGKSEMFNVRHFSLIFLLLMPGVSTRFMSLIPIAAFLLLTTMRGSIRVRMVIVPVGILALSLLFAMFREISGVSSVSIRDLTEVIRLLALLCTFALVMGSTEGQFARRLLLAVLLADFILSLSQLKILPGGIASALSRFYQSDYHFENALGISKRALGLFTDPTTHGLAMGLVALLFFSDTINKKGRGSTVGLVISLSLVVLAQSQTAFIATVIGMFTFFLVHFVSGPKLRAVIILAVLFGGAIVLLVHFAERLRYLVLLFQVGLKRNSFQRRVLKSEDSLDLMHDEPIGMLLGWGKNYLGSTSAALDNEYLFVYLVYGLPGVFLFLALLLAILVYAILTKQHVLLAATMFGVIAAYPASFFTNLKTFTIYCIVISATIATNKVPVLLARLR